MALHSIPDIHFFKIPAKTNPQHLNDPEKKTAQ